MQGTVKEYNRDRGFGFITGEDEDDYFVHLSGLGPKLQKFGLREGQQVAFDIDYNQHGFIPFIPKGSDHVSLRPGGKAHYH